MEAQLGDVKRNVKVVLNKLSPSSEAMCTIETGGYNIHYLSDNDVNYLVITEKSFPRKFAFSYLDELHKEFERSFGGQLSFSVKAVYTLSDLELADEARKPATRPYAFVKFDGFMQRTKRLYQDSRFGCPVDS